MLSARYGRMKIGRCVRQEPALVSIMQDPRYLGCSSNVVDFVSRQCSGRSQCTLRVNDQNFNIVSPCYDSLKMYLEATYVCLDGTSLFSQVEKQRSKTKFGEKYVCANLHSCSYRQAKFRLQFNHYCYHYYYRHYYHHHRHRRHL